MKRFAVFASDTYYPQGGMGDFQVSFDTRYEAEEYVKQENSVPRKYNPAKFGEFDHYDIEDMEEYE